jgi:hypothetical protein
MDDLIDSAVGRPFQVGVIKMDVQGFECYVMRGMPSLLARTFQIKCETVEQFLSGFDNCSTKILFSQMQESGFGLYTNDRVDPLVGNAMPGVTDYYAMKPHQKTTQGIIPTVPARTM